MVWATKPADGRRRDRLRRTATFGLNQSIPWTIEVVGGIQKVEADLRAVDVRRFDLTGGTDRMQLELGQPHGEVALRVVGGAKTIRIERPRGTAARVRVVGGSGVVTIDGQRLDRKGGQSTLETPAWDKSQDRIALEVVGGSKSIEIVDRP